jgi:enoyl-CoA hydratase
MAQPQQSSRRISVEQCGDGVVIARFDGGDLGLFGRDHAPELFALVESADRDPDVRAVVLTGVHPRRFISHADLAWLQEDGSVIPPVGRGVTSLVAHIAHQVGRTKLTRWAAGKTPLKGAVQLDRMHRTLSRMTTSSTIFVAALNGSALGLGAEIAWACDLRLMADGENFIGQLEILLGFPPGSGGTQRLAGLIGAHRALLAILEGRPYPAAEALEIGMIDEIVPAEQLLSRAVERARHLAARPTRAIGAVKRAVNLGSSQPVAEGLHRESAEFLSSLTQPQAQGIMLAYLRATAEAGELPLYQPGGYDAALARGNAGIDKMERQ